MTEKFPVRILVAGESADQFKMTTSIAKLAKSSRSIRAELAYLETDYGILIRTVKECLVNATQKHRADPRLMWLAGDHINRFLTRLDDIGFYLLRQSDTLAMHLSLSAPSVRKILSFRKRYPKLSTIDPKIPWSKYRENKVPRASSMRTGR